MVFVVILILKCVKLEASALKNSPKISKIDFLFLFVFGSTSRVVIEFGRNLIQIECLIEQINRCNTSVGIQIYRIAVILEATRLIGECRTRAMIPLCMPLQRRMSPYNCEYY